MNTPARLLVAFFTLFFITATNLYAADNSPVLSRIQKSGKMILGTSGNMPLMSEKLMTGEMAGFDVDMAKAMAESMGVELVIKELPFEKLIPALEKGTVDIVMSNMTMTVQRNMRVAFAGPYFISGKCLITKEEDMAKTDNTDKLNAGDITMVVIKGTTSENFVKELLPQLKRVTVSDVDAGTDKIAKGEAKAMMTDFPICLSVMKRHPDEGFQSVVSLLTYEPIGIALPANDPLFVNMAENFIMRAESVGLMDLLKLKWFGDAKITAVATPGSASGSAAP
ncbi:MAG: transporter substrate-binding domain-containing protein [Proteobacteria bacterium]|nr:transporter substrate-binding domain-containing protein [Pseudomonadota bacterium]